MDTDNIFSTQAIEDNLYFAFASSSVVFGE